MLEGYLALRPLAHMKWLVTAGVNSFQCIDWSHLRACVFYFLCLKTWSSLFATCKHNLEVGVCSLVCKHHHNQLG